jgi:4-alpha-glucanotransferase
VLHNAPVFPDASVDYEAVIPWKGVLLRQTAAQRVQTLSGTDRLTFEALCADKHAWLEAFARFMALKEANAGLSWT